MDQPTLIAIAVVEHDGQFLIGQRPSGTSLAGLWEFPGGKVEPGESSKSAAVRECREETGLDVDVVGTYANQRHQYDHGRVQLHFFACRPSNSNDAAAPAAPFRWVARADLARYEFPAANRSLLDALLSQVDSG